jgi:hypothetical protein
MKQQFRLLVILVAAGALGAGCSSSSGDTDGSGGTPGTGGAGTGGSATGGSGTGGSASGTGGLATGGTTGTGGAATGGATGTGGLAGNGGMGGRGGVGGHGGMAGAAGGHAGGGGAAATGGATGTGGATSGGGTTGFNPCPTDGSACKILPLGDSITYGLITVAADKSSSDPSINGKDSHGGYRVELFHKAVGASQKITFVGSVMNGPTMVDNMTFPQANEGHSGYTIDQMQPYVSSDMKYAPNIILLHIGTNDTYGSSPSGAPARLETLVNMLLSSYPNSLLVLAKIIPYPSQASNVTLINNSVQPLVDKLAGMGKHIVMVDLFTGFTTSSMLAGDGIHPNQKGYDFMGDGWYAAISSYLH